MNTRLFLLSAALVSILVTGCGGNKGGDPAQAKRQELKEKKAELLTLNQEIQQLEKELLALDPSTLKAVKQVNVSISTLKASPFQHFVAVQGKVESNRSSEVGPKSPGTITAIYVKEGQPVKTGTILAQLDDAVMRTSIQEANTGLQLATTLFEKQERLWKQEIGTEVQYLQAKNQKESIEQRIKTLQEQLDLYKIRAPFAGVVDLVVPKIGEAVSPGFPAFRVINSGDLKLKCELSESYIAYVRKGDKVKVSFPTMNKSFDGNVSVVGQFINPVNRTFIVEVMLPNDPMLKPNMFGEMAINDRTIKDAIRVPLSVVQNSELGNFVYIAEKGTDGTWTAHRRNIQLGLNSDGEVEVTSGLKDGDLLITAGNKDLSDGQQLIISGETPESVSVR